MEYTYLSDHRTVRREFLRRFTLPYGAFCSAHADQFAAWPTWYRKQYTQSYYERLPYSDRLTADFVILPFREALEQLYRMPTVHFLTNAPGGIMRDYAAFGTERLWAARTTGPELAEAIREDWFEMYELWEKDLNQPEPRFASEIYAFTPDLSQAIIFTHETDETELPDTRVCLILKQ